MEQAEKRIRWTPSPNWLWLLPILMFMAISPRTLPLDDAYITLHNARVLLSGHEDRVYGSSYMAGATSLVHLALVAAVSSVMDPVKGSLLLSLIGALLYIAGLTRVAARAGLTRGRLWAIVLIGASAGRSALLYTNGLETSLAMATVAWLFVWCDDRLKLPILAGVAPFIRPEIGLFSLLLMVRLGWCLPRSDSIRALIIAAACALPWLAWSLIEVGSPVASTISAKQVFYPALWSWDRRLLMMVMSYLNHNQLALFIGVVGLLKTRAGLAASLFLLGGLVVSMITFPDAANWGDGRYTAIYLPLLVAGLAAIAAERSRLSDAIITVMAVWGVYASAIATSEAHERLQRPIDGHAFFVASLPAASVVLIHDAGQVAWAAPSAKLVDMVGLKTPEAISINKRFKPGPCNFIQSLDYMVRYYRATHVALHNVNGRCPGSSLKAAGWRLRQVYSGDEYAVFEIFDGR